MMDLKFCTQCGHALSMQIPEGDNRLRHVCQSCGFIHYQNPKVVTGCVVYQGDYLLLCKRAIEPRMGYWTIPAGFLENEETTRQAAQRETLEETGAMVTAQQLFAITNSPRGDFINVFYLSELEHNHFHPTPESSEVKLVHRDDLPDYPLAFETISTVLDLFFKDKDRHAFTLHEIDF